MEASSKSSSIEIFPHDFLKKLKYLSNIKDKIFMINCLIETINHNIDTKQLQKISKESQLKKFLIIYTEKIAQYWDNNSPESLNYLCKRWPNVRNLKKIAKVSNNTVKWVAEVINPNTEDNDWNIFDKTKAA